MHHKYPHNCWIALVLATNLFAPGCSSRDSVGYEAGITPEERDREHTETPVPTPGPAKELISQTVTATWTVPRPFVATWFKEAKLEDIIHPIGDLPGVSSTDQLTPTWGEAGTRRRVVLTDGGSTLEEVLANDLPEHFRYIVWNYSTDAAKHLKYGVGHFHFEPDEHRTVVTWTYSMKPKTFLASLFLPRFMRKKYQPFMLQCMDRMERLVEDQYVHSLTSKSP